MRDHKKFRDMVHRILSCRECDDCYKPTAPTLVYDAGENADVVLISESPYNFPSTATAGRSIENEFIFENSFEGISHLIGKVKRNPAKAVLESTGNLWLRIYETLESSGIEVKLANPFMTKAIASARIKTDKLSARILAHLLRADLIAECYVSSKETRKVNALLRQRASLTEIQTMVKNQVHSLLDKYG